MLTGQIALLVYGMLMLAGGWFGHRAGSQASLIAGTASGTGLLLALLVTPYQMAVGLGMGAIIALVLSVVFALRLVKTRKCGRPERTRIRQRRPRCPR